MQGDKKQWYAGLCHDWIINETQILFWCDKTNVAVLSKVTEWAMSPIIHFWDYYRDILSCSQASATPNKMNPA